MMSEPHQIIWLKWVETNFKLFISDLNIKVFTLQIFNNYEQYNHLYSMNHNESMSSKCLESVHLQ